MPKQDVLPALEFAVAPRVRPVHHSVYTPEESAALQRAVGALHAFGLRPVAAQEDRPFGRGPGASHPEPAVRGLPAGASGPPLHFLPPVHTLGRFSDEVRLVNSLQPSTTLVAALEGQDLGIAVAGGSLSAPPSIVLQLQSALGPNLETVSYSVVSKTELELPVAAVGAQRIQLTVRKE